jgi:hypothetical protein
MASTSGRSRSCNFAFPSSSTCGPTRSSERIREGFSYTQWRAERIFVLAPAQAFVANWLSSFKDFPPRQKPASFSLDQIMDKLQSGARD